MVERWDRVVRLTHWCVALGFLANRLHLTEPGSVWHRGVGLAIAALVIVRLLWGVTGARGPARLSAIIPTKAALAEHFRDVAERRTPQALGHNPLGAMAIWLFWLLLPLVALTGWAQGTDLIDRWPVEVWHYWLVNAVTGLVCLHVLAVVTMSLWLRKNLITAMLPGRR